MKVSPEEKICYYCEYAQASEEEDTVFCQKKKRDVACGRICRKFSYDLLKKNPRPLPPIPTLSEEALLDEMS